jgi:hypothetical protein
VNGNGHASDKTKKVRPNQAAESVTPLPSPQERHTLKES